MVVESATARKIVDDDPDLSYLGTYGGAPDANYRSISRKEAGSWERGQYDWWVSGQYEWGDGCIAETEADFLRHEQYNEGAWFVLGIEVTLLIRHESGLTSELRDSLRGIESDSGEGCLDDVARELYEELIEQAEALDISIDNAPTWEWAE